MPNITSTDTSSKKKPHGSGKKRIEIKKIERESRRKVTFSKRRKGLFKKADELCRLASAEIAIIVFSPTGRLYSFGHPSVDAVVDRFLRKGERVKEGGGDSEETESAGGKSKDDEEESVCPTQELGFWWEETVEGLDLETAEKYKVALGLLRDNVAARLEEVMMRRALTRDYLGSME